MRPYFVLAIPSWLRAELLAHAESERKLHRLLRRAGLIGWTPQRRILACGHTYRVDVAFDYARLVIEVDGRRWHDAQSEQFEADRVRQNHLTAAGWRVLRFTWRRLTDDPNGVVAEIRAMLAADASIE